MTLLHAMLAMASLCLCSASGAWAHRVKVELFLDASTEDAPCSSEDNYTFTFKDIKLGYDECNTHLFPQLTETDEESWLQFSARAVAGTSEEAGMELYLYFTRDDVTGSITYCTEQNIDGLPYPLVISPAQNGRCQVIANPFDREERSLQVRVFYNNNNITAAFDKKNQVLGNGVEATPHGRWSLLVVLVAYFFYTFADCP